MNSEPEGDNLAVTEKAQSEPETSPETDSSLSDNAQANKIGNAFAATKKTYRQKGYEEGYLRAKQELEAASVSTEDKSVELPATPAPSLNYSADNAAHTVKTENISQMMLTKDLEKLRRKAQAKYSDYEEKAQKFVAEAAEASKAGDHDLSQLGMELIEIGDEDILYQVMSSADLRNEILQLNPKKWGEYLFKVKYNSEEVGHDHIPTLHVKTKLSPPIEELKNSSSHAKGTMSEREKEIEHMRRAALRLDMVH